MSRLHWKKEFIWYKKYFYEEQNSTIKKQILCRDQKPDFYFSSE